MSEDRTRELPGASSFEERVLTLFDRVFAELAEIRTRQDAAAVELAALRERQDSLEEKVDRRLQETRPIWEAVLSEVRALNTRVETVEADVATIKTDVGKIKESIEHVDAQFEVVAQQLFENAGDIKHLKKRVARLEEVEPT